MKKAISFTLSVFIILSVFVLTPPVSVSAVPSEGVYSLIDPRVLLAVFDNVEEDFNILQSDWDIKGAEMRAVSFIEYAPYSPYEGDSSLLVSSDNYKGGNKITLSRVPKTITSISEYAYIAFAVYVPELAGSTSVTLRCTAEKGTYSSTQNLSFGGWQIVFFELNDAPEGNLKNIEISFKAEKSGSVYFLIDCIGALKSKSDLNRARFLSSVIERGGCDISIVSGNIIASFRGSGKYIGLSNPVVKDLNGAGIMIALVNRSSCRTITLQYTTTGNEKKSLSVPIPDGSGEVSCLFPISDNYVSDISIHFDGSPSGEIEFRSVSIVPCYTPTAGVGKVTECRVSRDKKSISVKGSINEEEILKYEGCHFLLYELDLASELSSISLSDVPIAEAPLNGTEFSFTVPLDGNKNGLFKKYAVMIYYGGSLVPVSAAASVNNPEIFAENRANLPSGKKGIWPLTGNYVFDGIDQTVLEIRADKLLTLSQENAISYNVGGVRYGFSSEYVSQLDTKMAEYEKEDIAVRFILRLSEPEDLSLSSLLCHPNSNGGRYKAFNTVSEDGIKALRAITDFLVSRYAKKEGVTSNLFGIAVGTETNDAFYYYNMGKASLSYYAKHYAAALRTVYNTARSICSDFTVSASFGDLWCGNLVTSQKASFDSRSAIEALSACIKEETDFDWELAYDITMPEGEYAYSNTSPYFSLDALRVNASNLEVITKFMSRSQLYHNGSIRKLLLLGSETQSPKTENEIKKSSSDYVYTYLKLSSRDMDMVSGYIPSVILGNSDALRYVSTNLASEKLAFVSEIIGAERFEALVSASKDSGYRYYGENGILEEVPDSIKGKTVLFGFSKNESGFFPSINCASVEGGVSFSDEQGLLRIRLNSADANTLRGISVKLDSHYDLSIAPYLSFKIRCAVTEVRQLEIYVAVYSKDNVYVCTGTVSADNSDGVTVVCDIGDFPHLSSCSRVGIYVKGVNNEDIGEPTLIISSITALSEKLSGSKLDQAVKNPTGKGIKTVSIYTVILVAVIGVSAFTVEILRIIYKNRRKTENE